MLFCFIEKNKRRKGVSGDVLDSFLDTFDLLFEFLFVAFEVLYFLVFGEELTVPWNVIAAPLRFAATVAHFISS